MRAGHFGIVDVDPFPNLLDGYNTMVMACHRFASCRLIATKVPMAERIESQDRLVPSRLPMGIVSDKIQTHPLDVGRVVVALVEVAVMAVISVSLRVDAMPAI